MPWACVVFPHDTRETFWSWHPSKLIRNCSQMGEPAATYNVLSQVEDGRKRLRLDASFGDGQNKYEKYRCFDGITNLGGSGGDVLLDGNFYVDNVGPVYVVLSSTGIAWQALENKLDIGIICCWGLVEKANEPKQLAVSEIYGVEFSEPSIAGSERVRPATTLLNEENYFSVHAYKKSSQKGTWIPKTSVFHHADQGVCQRWANYIQSLLEKDTKRPKNLWVLINPHSGKKIASKTWEDVASLFHRAKINTKVVKTQRTRHAFEIMNNASDDELVKLDGVIIVGGDGLFNEVLNGLLLRRHRARLPHGPQSSLGKLETGTGEMMCAGSADLRPLLESRAVERTGSNSTSTGSLFSGFSHNEQGASIASSCSSPSSCHTPIVSVDHEPILHRDGGFVISSPLDGHVHSAEQTVEAENDAAKSHLLFPNQGLRIGIIPAGSTDSIAVSTTGSRNAATCALHIIFGEKMPLDVVRLVSWKSSSNSAADESPRVRYAASFAGYGFYGDVIKESEPNRWMGPVRYDYAGTKVFFQHKLYEAEVSFIEIPDNDTLGPDSLLSESLLQKEREKHGGLCREICHLNCSVCANGVDLSEMDEAVRLSSQLEKAPRWKHVRGSFVSVGAAVISCRNDKAPNGVAASAHLADGFLHLILVKECSRLAYLWHLIQLTREDADPLDFAFVEEYKTPLFHFISHGEESVWNVDGELFPAHQLSGQVFRGLVNIFASGPDV